VAPEKGLSERVSGGLPATLVVFLRAQARRAEVVERFVLEGVAIFVQGSKNLGAGVAAVFTELVLERLKLPARLIVAPAGG
jgi:hypothetical protein